MGKVGAMTDRTMPEGRWEFDAAVTEVFADMLERSIPDYQTMRSLVARLGERIIDGHPLGTQRVSRVLDLGTSRGDAIDLLLDRLGVRCRYVGVDVSEPMLEAARQRFASWGNVVDIRHCDLRHDFPGGAFDVVQAVLAVMFVPIEYRPTLIGRVYDSLTAGGGLVMVEKVLGSTRKTDEMLTGVYLEHKAASGYSQEAIDRKRLSLEGVLVPLTAAMNESMLRDAGFRAVECVWRWANFAAWVAIK